MRKSLFLTINVISPDVRRKRTGVFKTLVTHAASERLIIVMHLFVRSQIRRGLEALVTLCAFKWPIAGVDPSMRFQFIQTRVPIDHNHYNNDIFV